MVSLCIKTTKNDVADFLMQSLDSVDLDDVVFVQKEFSKYINVIVHYLGNNIPVFYNVIAELLTDCIIANYESSIVYNLLVLNYFYFSNDDINIIVISANRMIMDKVGNLDLGADDYIEKPFDLLELISRVNAHLRRRKKSDVLSVGNLSIDTSKRTCTLNDEEVLLTTREFDILTLLISSAGKTVTREQILKKIWGIDDKNLETRTIDMHIKSLRKKLNDVNQEIIVTVYGVGYKINI